MQVNSAQDYLTAQKRRVIGTLSAVTPQPAHRRYNYVYLSTVANGESKYEKTPYPQNLSLAAGSKPGLAYVTQGVRPTVDLCCVMSIPPVVVQPPLYAFTTFTFSPAATTGRLGPTLATLTSYSTYAATSWAGNTAFLNMYAGYQGIQVWTVPKSGSYQVTCAGASLLAANNRGAGQIIQTTLTLSQGQKLLLLAGQCGIRDSGGSSNPSGGSGGSFVALPGSTGTEVSAATCLVAAGGGGGTYPSYSTPDASQDGTTADAGNSGLGGAGGGGGVAGADGGSGHDGGSGGGGGGHAGNFNGGGGGFTGNGGTGTFTTSAAKSFRNGGAGGDPSPGTCIGGFGGGGCGNYGNGGGGGWSGGGGDQGQGGGGGSYPPGATDMGKNTTVLTGYITITAL